MHAAKTCDALSKLSQAPADLDTYTKASVLLTGLATDNADVDEGFRLNGTVRDKIHSILTWFEILCGIGEDGEWAEMSVREFIRSELSGLRSEIDNETESVASHFKKWAN